MRWIVRQLVLLLAFAAPALAQSSDVEVRAVVSSGEVYVNEDFQLTIEIVNGQDDASPVLPDVPGLRVMSGPGRGDQESTLIVNGRVTVTRTITYTYRLRATRPGVLLIPPIDVATGGATMRTGPQRLNVIAVEAIEPDDVLIVEVTTNETEIYLGEPLQAQLRVWIRQYTDERYGVRLDDGNTWSLIEDSSTWGPFADRMREYNRIRRRPAAQQMSRASRGGESSRWYMYEISATIWPDTAGPLDLSSIRIDVGYPRSLRRTRNPFRDLEIAATTAVSATARPPNVLVKPLPTEDRPSWFTGAVGRFDMRVTAEPDEVAVGDPITVSLTIKDLTRPTTPLEYLQPPALARAPGLTERFRLPDEPLAGVVENTLKRFTQTIRARSEDVRQLPALPFSYFDPRAERYETVWSDPIDLTVRPASTLDMADVVGAADTSGAAATALTSVTGGLLANHGDPSSLLQTRRDPVGWWLALVLVLPPVLYAGVVAGHQRRLRLRNDQGYARRRRARRQAEKRLSAARSADPAERSEALGSAVSEYVADRCNLPAGVTTTEVVRRLQEFSVDTSLVEEIGAFLASCEQSKYAGVRSENGSALAEQAERIIRNLERERLA